MSSGNGNTSTTAAPTSSRFSRRLSSVPRDLRTSFESVSSRLTFNRDKNASNGNGVRHVSVDGQTIPRIGRPQSVVDGQGSRRASSTLGMPAMAVIHNQYDSTLATAPANIHQRSASSLSFTDAVSIHSSQGSQYNAPTGRWFERLRRNSNRTISREIDSAVEEANEAAAHRTHNPFLRKRSVASVLSVTSFTDAQKPRSVMGANPGQAAQIGGTGTRASTMLLSQYISTSGKLEVPYIVDACIAYLLQHDAISVPGLFRVSGSNATCRALAEHFSDGSTRIPLEEVVLPGEQVLSVHDVASTLKRFLSSMPGGLLGESVFMELQELSEEEPERRSARDIAEALTEMSDPLKFAICLLHFGLLATIAARSAELSAEASEVEQEKGYMSARNLGIVFAPACLGSSAAGMSRSTTSSSVGGTNHDMRRSSTSHSDYSFKSDASTQIEEAKLQATQAGRVIEMLIAHWQEVVPMLDQLTGTAASDTVSQQQSQRSSHDYARQSEDMQGGRQLDTIIDSSPIKPAAMEHHRRTEHARNMSVDTVTQGCTCDKAKHRASIQVQGLENRLAESEKGRVQALETLARRTAALDAAELEIEALRRELALAKLVHEGPSAVSSPGVDA